MSRSIIDTERKGAGKALRMLCMNFCIAFTIFMLMSMVFGMIFADEQAKQGILYCWTIAGAMLAAAIMRLIFFTPFVIRKMSYPLRTVLFGVCFYGVLAVLGAAFDWFPADEPVAWISFTVIYLVTLALLTVIFSALYRRETKRLNEKLVEYKVRH